MTLPTDPKARKNIPLCTGCFDYFTDALAAVAELSQQAVTQHGLDGMYWDRSKSQDHADCILRHQAQRGTRDTDGILHSVKVAWRALAQAQLELEELNGSPPSRGSRAAQPVEEEPPTRSMKRPSAPPVVQRAAYEREVYHVGDILPGAEAKAYLLRRDGREVSRLDEEQLLYVSTPFGIELFGLVVSHDFTDERHLQFKYKVVK